MLSEDKNNMNYRWYNNGGTYNATNCCFTVESRLNVSNAKDSSPPIKQYTVYLEVHYI